MLEAEEAKNARPCSEGGIPRGIVQLAMLREITAKLLEVCGSRRGTGCQRPQPQGNCVPKKTPPYRCVVNRACASH